ncbi:MAG TPA: flagellar brake protein [Rhodocyclaceae bacterium]|nr:flagellar brake protein [Rhodocyclaceae bacterium]
MPESVRPATKFELLRSNDFEQYLLHERREIAYVLRQLAARRCMTTAYFGSGSSFIMTSVLAVSDDDRSIHLDLGNDEAMNIEAANSTSLLCLTQLDKVKVQFSVARPRLETFGKYPALLADTPEVLLRLQRREYYRLIAPVAHALICHIPTPEPNTRVEARVIDISGGGLAVLVPPKDMQLSVDDKYLDCRLELPDFGPVTVSLRVRNIFHVTHHNGTDLVRAGCQFENLPTPIANAIQRYILRVERDRKAREIGE